MNEHEFKAMLGIHKTDHENLLDDGKLQSLYPGIKFNLINVIDETVDMNGNYTTFQSLQVKLEWKGKKVIRKIPSFNNKALALLLRELDPL